MKHRAAQAFKKALALQRRFRFPRSLRSLRFFHFLRLLRPPRSLAEGIQKNAAQAFTKEFVLRRLQAVIQIIIQAVKKIAAQIFCKGNIALFLIGVMAGSIFFTAYRVSNIPLQINKLRAEMKKRPDRPQEDSLLKEIKELSKKLPLPF